MILDADFSSFISLQGLHWWLETGNEKFAQGKHLTPAQLPKVLLLFKRGAPQICYAAPAAK